MKYFFRCLPFSQLHIIHFSFFKSCVLLLRFRRIHLTPKEKNQNKTKTQHFLLWSAFLSLNYYYFFSFFWSKDFLDLIAMFFIITYIKNRLQTNNCAGPEWDGGFVYPVKQVHANLTITWNPSPSLGFIFKSLSRAFYVFYVFIDQLLTLEPCVHLIRVLGNAFDIVGQSEVLALAILTLWQARGCRTSPIVCARAIIAETLDVRK